MGQWLLYWTGIGNEAGKGYGFWSGIGSCLGYLGIIGTGLALIRSRNCEVHRCWRLGRHQTAAGHRVCRAHHPDDRLTHRDVIAAHDAAQ